MKTKIVRKRHQRLVSVANTLIAPFVRKKVGFIQQKYNVKHLEPFIVVSNHASAFDPILVTGSFNRQVYYMASDLTFSKGIISRLLVWAFSPIPKSKSQTDVGSVKKMIQTVKEGGNVGVFIEGNSTITGTISNIPTGVGKLVLMLKRPLIIYNIHGAYLSNPRWSSGKRKKRRVTGEIKQILMYEDYKDLSIDELNTIINEAITVNAYDDNDTFKYKGKRNAEGLHRLLWMCPDCGSANTLEAKGNTFICSACSFTSHYNEYGYLESSHFDSPKNMVELDEQNKLAYQDYIINNSEYALSETGRFLEVFRKRRRRLGEATITLTREGLNVNFKRQGLNPIFYPFDELDTFAMQQKEGLIIYLKHEQTKVIHIPNTNKVGPYEFMIAFQILKNLNEQQGQNKKALIKLDPKQMGL